MALVTSFGAQDAKYFQLKVACPMSNSRPRIIIFDSGVGGLSIFKEVQRQLPGCDIVFASDSAGFPYGIRSETDLISRVEKVIDRLVIEIKPNIVIVACNSASTVVLPLIRSQFDTPFIGVVPAVKPAAAQSRSRSIGLLATPATVSRDYTTKLIEDFAKDCQVKMLGSSELVYLAEAKLRGETVPVNQVAEIIAPLFNSDPPELDTIVLACTHFPLLLEELKLAVPHPVQWIDSSEAIARRALSLLGEQPKMEGYTPQHRAIFTGNAEVGPSLTRALTNLGIDRIENMDI